MSRPSLRGFDQRLRADCFEHLFGVDEVGRGSLAGPVVAAAVVLPPDARLRGVNDSKVLTAEEREEILLRIRAVALAISCAFVGPRQIEQRNIRRASLLAMWRAVRRASILLPRRVASPGPGRWLVVVDGIDEIPELPLPQRAVIGGDGASLCVAAASIVAKTARDRFMRRLGQEDPRYGFERHMGYGTPEHLESLDRHGICRWHRLTFAPIAQTSLFPVDEFAT